MSPITMFTFLIGTNDKMFLEQMGSPTESLCIFMRVEVICEDHLTYVFSYRQIDRWYYYITNCWHLFPLVY